MFPVFMQLVIVHPGRHWHTWLPKKALSVLRILLTMKRNTIISLNPWIITMFPAVLIVLLKLLLLVLQKRRPRKCGYEIKVGKFPLSASGKASAAGHHGRIYKSDI